ncbi:hypothetical protein BSL78_03895 [Apostichopus japonicus]|uniref:Uncharacterized protein n=1 Tax=Stichopus japonicus TaxID=307972 RepID=A0A2G8LG19_STIJA|nr:hypothetical protein BSL78_03895 [Apostichopus japonicus]
MEIKPIGFLLFTLQLDYPWLKGTLTVLLSKNDCHQLARHVALPKYQLDAIVNSDSSAKDLLDVLEERGVIHPFNVSRLLEAIKILKINQTAMFMLERYQESRGDETSYGRFLAGLSSHLTLSLPRKLCDYFEFTNEKKKAVITSKTPGISFLLTLEDMGVINPLDVGKLLTPLKQYQLVQAVAKVQEYQTLVDERIELTKPINTLEGKQALFIECLRKKTKSWYETMTPLPWKKSCKWMTSELFVACGLVLTNSKAKMKTTNVDPKSKLQYTDILTHERLKSATRIIIEGIQVLLLMKTKLLVLDGLEEYNGRTKEENLPRSEGSESEIISTRLSEIAFNGYAKDTNNLCGQKVFLMKICLSQGLDRVGHMVVEKERR